MTKKQQKNNETIKLNIPKDLFLYIQNIANQYDTTVQNVIIQTLYEKMVEYKKSEQDKAFNKHYNTVREIFEEYINTNNT